MAFMDQEKKKVIAAKLKAIVPKGWKYSLAVRHHSKIVLNLKSAPVDLLADVQWSDCNTERNYLCLQGYYLDRYFSGANLTTIKAIFAALNHDNFDHSDSMTDYFCYGHFVELNIGNWDRPFICTTLVTL